MSKIYSPEVSMPEKVTGVSATKEVTFNTDVIGYRLAKKLYRNEASGLRELAANGKTAIEAAIKAGYLSRKDSKLLIKFTSDGRVIIEDNGTGISMEAFETALCIMGNSTNFDSEQAGQMGMGFYAFTTVSSTARIDTMTEDGKSFSAICRDAREFKIFDKSARKTRGTTITLQLYDGGKNEDDEDLPKTNVDNLIHMANEIGRCSKINMEVDTSEYYNDEIASRSNYITKYGTTGIMQTVSCKFPEDDIILFENKDLEVLVYASGEPTTSSTLFLAGLPIGEHGIELDIIVNVKDERKYKPMPERERLTKDAHELMTKNVKKLLEGGFDGLFGISDYKTYIRSPKRSLFGWVTKIGNCSNISGKLTAQVRALPGIHSNYFLLGNETETVSIFDIMKTHDLLVFCNPRNEELLNIAVENGMKPISCAPTYNSIGIKTADRWGIPRIKDVFDANGIKYKTDMDILEKVTCHYHGNHEKLQDAINTKKIVMFDIPCSQWLDSALSSNWSDCGFVCWTKELVGMNGITPYSEWIAEILDRKVDTNKGRMTIREAGKKRVVIMDQSVSTDVQESLLPRFKYIIIRDKVGQFEAYMASRELGHDGSYDIIRQHDISRLLYDVSSNASEIVPLVKVGLFDKMDPLQKKIFLNLARSGNMKTNIKTVARAVYDTKHENVEEPIDKTIMFLKNIDAKVGDIDMILDYCDVVSSITTPDDKLEFWARILQDIVIPKKFGCKSSVSGIDHRTFEFEFNTSHHARFDPILLGNEKRAYFRLDTIKRSDDMLEVRGRIRVSGYEK